MSRPKLFVAGNWKMNGFASDLIELKTIDDALSSPPIDIVVFPPATLLMAASKAVSQGSFKLGAQDCHVEKHGAYTGDLSAAILKDAGASSIILGHSERRNGHKETGHLIKQKAESAYREGLSVVLCIGETAAERDAGQAEAVCQRQIDESLPNEANPKNTVIAYEPVWAIGSGEIPSMAKLDVFLTTLRAHLRAKHDRGLEDWRLIYGGSVTSQNTDEILSCANVDGVLVGSASLKAQSFLSIIESASSAAKMRFKD